MPDRVRAKILEMGKAQCLVRLIDSGEELNVHVNELKVPHKYAFEAPPYAYRCSLDLVSKPIIFGDSDGPPTEGWDSRIVAKLRKLGKFERLEDRLGGFGGLTLRCLDIVSLHLSF